MILADKIINLRKKAGMSQEELADKIGVSRQAVSKWESMQSVPDLDKILLMSKVFGVTTDFLLKDEIEEEVHDDTQENETEKRKVTMEMASKYIELKFQTASKIAIGVLLCILSPIALFYLGIISEIKGANENLLCIIGLIILFIFVAIAICLFIVSGNKVKEYEFLESELFETTYGVTGMVKEKKKNFQDTYFKYNLIGVILCVLSVIPLFIGLVSENDLYCVIGLSVMLLIAGIGVFMFVLVGCKMGALARLLQEGDFSKTRKENYQLMSAISSCYWAVATIVYLVWSFISEAWNITWVVWVVAGILYGGLYTIVDALTKRKKDK